MTDPMPDLLAELDTGGEFCEPDCPCHARERALEAERDDALLRTEWLEREVAKSRTALREVQDNLAALLYAVQPDWTDNSNPPVVTFVQATGRALAKELERLRRIQRAADGCDRAFAATGDMTSVQFKEAFRHMVATLNTADGRDPMIRADATGRED